MAYIERFEKDILETSSGDLEITFLGHGSLMLDFQRMIIHIDPFSKVADYSRLPKADIVLLTHEHRDHLDQSALERIRTRETQIVLPEVCTSKVVGGIVMLNGETRAIQGINVEAIPAYNLLHKRENGQPFHPKGIGNGYILTIADLRIYVAGDTENIPEMKNIKDIDCAFLPMNLPYTMTPEMVADAAETIQPKILYPYHYGDTDTSKLLELLKDQEAIEVRIRRMA